MNDQSLRVLIIEDSEDDELIIIRELKKGGYNPVYERVETAAVMKKALKEKPWDIILCDYTLPKFNAPSAIAVLKETNIDIPIIIVSGTIGEDVAIECMRLGAQDYIMKGNLSRLCPAIARELEDAKVRNKQKQADEELLKSAKEWQITFDAANDAIWILDQDQRVLQSNKTAERFFHRPLGEIIGKHCWEIVHGTEQPIPECPVLLVRKNLCRETLELQEGERWFAVNVDPILDEDGLYLGAVHIVRDITERKQKEEEHKAHIRFLESLERIDQAIKQETDVEQMLRHILQEVFVLFDCDRAWLFYPCDPDAPTFRVPMEICGPEYPGAKVLNVDVPMSSDMAQDLRDALASDDPVIYIAGTEKPINKVTAEQFGVQSQMFVALYPKLSKPWVFGMHQCSYPHIWTEEEKKLFKEISRRISDGLSGFLYLRKLQENERRLSEAQRLANIGSWEWDAITDTITWSNEYYRIYGFDPTQHPPGYEEHLKAYTPESAVQLDAAVKRNMQTGEPYELDLELANPKGPCRWITARSENMRDAQGKIIGLRGTAQDITEHKQAEEELKTSEAKYRNIFENSVEGIYQSTMEGRFITANPALARMSGYDSPEELIESIKDMGTQLYVHSGDRERFMEIRESKGFVEGFEVEFYKKDGGKFWVVINARTVKDEQGKILYIEGLIEDITVRKHAEEQLHQTLDRLKKAVGTTIQVLVSAVESRDPYTAGHQFRVADLARAIATEMGLAPDKIEGIRMAGSIHDIGKLSIPAEILVKPTKLTNIEISLIKEHSQIGYEMLKDVESPWPLAQIVYQHHERMNGSGYPRNLKGDEILMEARIMAVADVVEAMASHRPYRPALGIDVALEEIERNKGILYDDVVADACLRLFREKGYQLK